MTRIRRFHIPSFLTACAVAFAASGLLPAQLAVAAAPATSEPETTPAPGVGEARAPALSDSGWRKFNPSEDSRIIYVSASRGRDAHAGRSAESPVRTIERAKQLVRDGRPDWVVFRAGDVWPRFGRWDKSGRGPDEPMVLASYGRGPRPRFLKGLKNVKAAGSFLAFVHLHFDGRARFQNPQRADAGVRWLAPARDVHFESVLIEGYRTGAIFQSIYGPGKIRNVSLRRCVIVDSFSADGQSHSQGLFAKGVHGLTIEQCVFDHNGWAEGVGGAEPTKFNHNLYIQHGTRGFVLRDSIVARGAAHGLQARNAGVVEGNVFVGNSIASLVSSDVHAGKGSTPPQRYVVRDNVALSGSMRRLADDAPRGWGFQVYGQGTARTAAILAGNLAIHTPAPKARNAWDGARPDGAVIVFDWGGEFDPPRRAAKTRFPDPTRDVAAYLRQIRASFEPRKAIETFLKKARAQHRGSWDPAYTADGLRRFIREGFGLPTRDPAPGSSSGDAPEQDPAPPADSTPDSDSRSDGDSPAAEGPGASEASWAKAATVRSLEARVRRLERRQREAGAALAGVE